MSSADCRLILGDCRDKLPTLAAGSVDAVICDPPYPEISRPYGRMTEAEWHAMMRVVVPECRRALKPTGSAVFILQPNYRTPGSMRLWLWEFVVWAGREWNLVQNAYWWNFTAKPTQGCQQKYGLMRPSVKMCVWLGELDCYRDQDDVLWEESERNKACRSVYRINHGREKHPSGKNFNRHTMAAAAMERGGVTPFNLLPFPVIKGPNSGGANGHAAATPLDLMDWWIRYISRPGDVICDPFCGSGTTGLAALKLGRSFIGIEREPAYVEIARRRLAAHQAEVSRVPECHWPSGLSASLTT